ncbi:YhcN/YlaJ family sporulation lipoprotein [Thalassobacillus sp. CUG 92003]|uniref:YhcN/YlaJ family sporulation lipoprotein n=1 Tax=Thalassobacillus sp. CUG 92003 TaxID=2736641 RepID=UPI0015E7A0FB|nr:YhcN/YlaJ family sporulation lipoprotein [Thalassobacillus sp. CUG 92003]
MKIKTLAVGLLAASTLVACQAEQEEGRGNGNYDGVENTRFERMADDMNEMDNNNENNNVDNDRNQVGNDNYDVAEKTAEQITSEVDDVEDAYVLTTRNNAYVAADMKGQQNGDVSDDVEKEISKVVKKTNQDIDNVYVSTNPDFVDLTNNYVQDVENGEPVQGFFREFGDMVNRIFPDAE